MLISVLTPTRNRRGWIRRAVRSVTAQTYQEWELIVYDVGDEGNTVDDLLVGFDDPRIRYVRGQCEGPAADFQAALELAQGEVVTPLSDDDRLPPHALATAAQAFQHQWDKGAAIDGIRCKRCAFCVTANQMALLPADLSQLPPSDVEWLNSIAACNVEWLNGRTVLVNEQGDPVALRGGTRDHLEDTRDGKFMLGGAVYWRKSLTDQLGGFDTAFDHGGDHELYTRFLAHSDPVRVLDTLYIYTDHPATDTRVNAERQAEASRRVAARVAAERIAA